MQAAKAARWMRAVFVCVLLFFFLCTFLLSSRFDDT